MKNPLQKLKAWWNNAKFNLAVKAIFIFAVVVSFSHTMELYRSVGFDVRIDLLNRFLGVNWVTLALFATLAAEAAFAVGLWGLYDAYEQSRRFPSVKEYWQIWTLFCGGLLIVGWSNIGGTVGYNFLIGQPYKGIALGLSIPLFVLGSVLVNFKRKHQDDAQIESAQKDAQNQVAQIEMHKKEVAQIPAQNLTHAQAQIESAQISNAQIEVVAQKDLSAQISRTNEKDVYLHKNRSGTQDAQIEQVQLSEQVESAQNESEQVTQKVAQVEKSQGVVQDAHSHSNEPAHKSGSNVSAQKSESAQEGKVAQKVAQKVRDRLESAHAQNQQDLSAQEDAQIIAQRRERLYAKYAHLLSDAQINAEIREAMRRAVKYEVEHGKLPTINDLKDIAQCSPWFARVALNKLKGKPVRKTG